MANENLFLKIRSHKDLTPDERQILAERLLHERPELGAQRAIELVEQLVEIFGNRAMEPPIND
jgi:hypothetical protein